MMYGMIVNNCFNKDMLVVILVRHLGFQKQLFDCGVCEVVSRQLGTGRFGTGRLGTGHLPTRMFRHPDV